MNIIILILGTFILLSKKSLIVNLFKTKDDITKATIQGYEDIKVKLNDDSIFYTLIFIIMSLLSGMHILFYILSCVYIGSFLFTIISVLFMIIVFKNYFKTLAVITDLSSYKGQTIVWRVIDLLTDLVYIAFVFYTIYIRW